MASAIPVLSGHEVVRVFENFGWHVARQHSSLTVQEFTDAAR